MSASKSKKPTEKDLEIKEQIEYYLSDKNLEHDSFFHQKISGDPNGYVSLDLFLKCNKIKKAEWTKEDLKKGIKFSDIIELDKSGDKVRRKENKPLPELKLLTKKRKKEEDEEDEKEAKDPKILILSTKSPNETKWQKIIDTFKDLNPELNVTYGRFKDCEGHVAVVPDENNDIKFTETFKVEDNEYNVKICEGEALINFWKDHGSHYEMCVKMKERRKKAEKTRKNEKNKKGKKESDEDNKNTAGDLNKEVTLGGQKFSDINLIRAEARNIINSYKDEQELKEKDKNFVLDLLKYHHNYEEKIKDLDHVAVGKPEKFNNSRCFIIVTKKKEKKDFSFQKCIENISKQDKK